MTAPFAALEARVISGALGMLANCEVTFGGVTVAGIFDNGNTLDLSDAVIVGNPTLQLAAETFPMLDEESVLTINGTAYVVRAKPLLSADGGIKHVELGVA